MADKNIVEKVKEIAEQASKIKAACEMLVSNPVLADVEEFARLLGAFASGQGKLTAAPQTRTRRTKAEIEAERLAKESKAV
jgi:hypothetical protein